MAGLPEFENRPAQRVETTTCYMCACRCGIKVTLEGDSIRYIAGNRDHPVNKGVLCAKGNAGIMKQASPAKLRQPMRRKPGTERGAGEYEPISWDEALELLTERLAHIRRTDPKRLAFFTGRDQMQALSGFWATQFGTINWAAHGGFCSVNMAAAGLYTTGQSFWEFGDPDWDRARYFMLWGVAEDHASNPLKIGIEKLKRRGAKFVAINPVRTGYQAVADEWIGIRPGTDGLLALAFAHVLLQHDRIDHDYLLRYTNAAHLVIHAPGTARHGRVLRDADGTPLVWDAQAGRTVPFGREERLPALLAIEWIDDPAMRDPADGGSASGLGGEAVDSGSGHDASGATVDDDDARRLQVRTAFSLVVERCLDPAHAPAAVAERTGVSADTIERLALEMAEVAFEQSITVETPWTDTRGVRHERFVGRPVAMHAMRGVSAHSNGFQSCRAIHLVQLLLGAVDTPGSHLAKPPFPRHLPPPIRPASANVPETPLSSPPLGFPTGPEDLVIDGEGRPLRIDKAYSWEAPLANHGLMHMVIHNAVKADPYRIDTLILFMANMAWNSAMNTAGTQELLREKDDAGDYKLPFVVVSDAFDSEMVRHADLVLPDTTYLERHDTISLLDRPISEPHAVCDAIRQPVVAPDRDVRPWQEVLIELGTRLGFPALVHGDGSPRYTGYEDFIVRFEKSPGIGFLAGWRGSEGTKSLVGAPNPNQWQAYKDNGCFFEHRLPPEHRYYRFANRSYLEWSVDVGFNAHAGPVVMELYSETLQKFRLAGQGLYDGPLPRNDTDRERLVTHFDPLPVWHEPLEEARVDAGAFPFHAVNQRPMFMYHSWDSQNAWLRQIMAQNHLYMNRARGESLGLADLDWVWVTSHHGRIRCQLKLMEGCNPDTVWTWNAIGKQPGAWALSEKSPEARQGFLMNHLISELLPRRDGERALTNSDPVTGQAAWYDLKVRVEKAPPGETGTWPICDTLPSSAAGASTPSVLQYQAKPAVRVTRSWRDALFKA